MRKAIFIMLPVTLAVNAVMLTSGTTLAWSSSHWITDARFYSRIENRDAYQAGRSIDVFTTRGGKGSGAPSEPFGPNEEVVLDASVTYNQWPVQQKDVAFAIRDPSGSLFSVLYARTNSSGIAVNCFHPSFSQDVSITAYGSLGNWTIIATVSIADYPVNDTMELEILPSLVTDLTYSPRIPYAYETVTFNAVNAFGSRFSHLYCAWDFGDGNEVKKALPTINHTYVKPGTYDVTLAVASGYGLISNATKSIIVLQDDAPPSTVDNYDQEWHNSYFTIDLTASDAESGVEDTHYRYSNGSVRTVRIDGQPSISDEESNGTLEYWSVDKTGNEELPHEILTGIRLDKTAPTIESPSRTPMNDVQSDQQVMVSIKVTDFTSKVKNATLEFTNDEGFTWYTLPMTYNTMTGLYEGIIGGQRPATKVQYKITAYDYAENFRTADNESQYYVYSTIPESPSQVALILIATLLLQLTIIYTAGKRSIAQP